MKFSHLIILWSFLLLSTNGTSQSHSNVLFENPGGWVTRIDADMDAQPAEAESEGVYYLLIDKQANVVKSERYFHTAYRIMTVDGLQQNADLTVDFDPTYQQLTFHEATIIRDGERLNQLHPVAVKVVQREQQMDRYLYDGKLTAIIHLRDLRIGDIVEYSYSKKGFNPVYDGHYAEEVYFQYSVPYERGHFKVISPTSKNLRLIYRNGEDPPSVTRTDTELSYTWDFNKMNAVRFESFTPGWFVPNYRVLLTDFNSWDDLKPWMLKHYQLDNQQVNRLKSEIGDYFKGDNNQITALNVIRFVQDEVRYLGFEEGMHSHKPHAPLQIFQQRFGDCKDKSMLLCALLACYDIEANPVIVNSALRKHVAAHMPAISAFDHAVTQVIADGDTIYVDPTISNQGGGFNHIFFPDYGNGFVVHPTYGGMSEITREGIAEIDELKEFTLESVGAGSGLIVQTTYYGAEADWIRTQLTGTSLDQIQQNYLEFYANMYPEIEAEFPAKVIDNRDENIIEITEYYHIPQFWDSEGEMLSTEFFVYGLDQYVNIAKSNNRRKTPYQLNYPTTYKHSTKIHLPESWEVEKGTMEIIQPEYKYFNQTSYDNGVILLYHEYQTLKNHVPLDKMEIFVNEHQQIRNNLSFQLQYNEAFVGQESGVAAPPLILTILTLLAGIWFMIKVYRYDPQSDPEAEHRTTPRPIGGWLVLISFGIALTPLLLIYQVFIDDSFYNPAYWYNFMKADNIAYSLFISLQLIYNLTFILFSIVLAILFFQRRSSVPRLVLIRLLGDLFATMVIMAIGSALVEGVEYGKDELFELSKMFVSAAIWVPYFLISTRVKETFLNRDNQSQERVSPTHTKVMADTGEI